MTAVIELAALEKSYRRFRRPPTVAVAHLDLSVPEGGVFGFLGPNGSGKTTTIRCLLGLVRPTGGVVRLLGRPVPEGLGETMRSVGAVVESANLLPNMTGREQIRLLAKIDGIPTARADESLASVGLEDRGGERVSGYSLGMRQRLGLAAALLKDPALLVLDEPANGLDPAGMRDIRELLRRLGAEGRTVFLSSHLLSEVEQTCDRVAIIDRGRCVVTSTVTDLLDRSGDAGWLVEVDDAPKAASVLIGAGMAAEVVGQTVRVSGENVEGATISRRLGERGHWVQGLRRQEVHLEDLFLELTDPAPVGAGNR
ncbi:MAG: ABC transporter ATP-binding protein [Actinomycetota bacterium]|nr:ABC transporter ATP-binding protein [Actinomycetota bacterium]